VGAYTVTYTRSGRDDNASSKTVDVFRGTCIIMKYLLYTLCKYVRIYLSEKIFDDSYLKNRLILMKLMVTGKR